LRIQTLATNSSLDMDLSKINTRTLNSLIRLTKRKETLLKAVEKVEEELKGLLGGKRLSGSIKAISGKKAGRKKTGKRQRRPALKAQVIAALKEAGKAGSSVKDIAQKIKIKPQNLHVWFSTTGKKFKEIVKVAQGRYRLK
jgi:hypothetical protein